MVALTGHSSPGSLQLKLGLKCRRSSYVLLRIRFPESDGRRRRIRLVSAAVSGSPASEGGEGRESSASSNGPSDSFSGWGGDESDGGSQPKGRFGGIMGVGLAGVFLAAGITFALLSLGNRKTGVKQQMEPLTTQQENLFVSDDQNENIDQVGNESSVVVSENDSLPDSAADSKTSIYKENISPIETTESTSESAGVIVDAISKASSPGNLNISTHDVAESTNSSLSLTEMSEYNVIDPSSNASSLIVLHSNMASGTSDSIDGSDENLGTANLVGLPTSTDPTNLNADHQEGIFYSDETENSKLPLNSGGSSAKLLNDPLTFDSSLTVKTNADPTVQSLSDSEVVEEKVNSVSWEQDSEISEKLPLPTEVNTSPPLVLKNVPSGVNTVSDSDQSETLQLMSEDIDSPLGGQKLDASGTIEAPASAPVSQFGNEPYINGQEVDKSRPLFESAPPESSFLYAGIPAPSLVSAVLQVPPGKVVVPAVVDQVQGQALTALQVLKVIEHDVQPGDICTRREYTRWLVSASSALSRNNISKVYPAMYIENMTELAFDDVTPEDPDFPFIQGLAEAGLISSKLSRSDMNVSLGGEQDAILFSPESPISRQDLVSWKMAIEKRQLPEVDREILYQRSGYIDIDKIDPTAWPALVADLSAGEHGIIPLAFGYTRLFQPGKPVTKAQVAIALATGDAAEVVGEELARIEAESLADAAVAAHSALVAQVEKDLNASFERELSMEREKIDAVEKLAEEARLELEKLRKEREEENNDLQRGRAAVESELEVLSRLRNEVEEQLQSLLSNKMEIAFERDRINKLHKEAESENQAIVQLQYELEVERRALSMARAWAEDEAKRAREQAKALEEARERWERHGLKVVVERDLCDDANAGTTWLNAGKESPTDETINRAENLVEKFKLMAGEMKGKSATVVEKIIQKIVSFISALKQRATEASQRATELQSVAAAKVSKSIQEIRESATRCATEASQRATEFQSVAAAKTSKSIQDIQVNTSELGSSIKDGAKKVVEDFRECAKKITQKFKA